MTKLFRKHSQTRFLIPVVVALTFLIHACQQDPILEPSENEQVPITPKSRGFITALRINNFPPVDLSGNTWDAIDTTTGDLNGDPDIFFNITDPSPDPPVFWSQNSHFSNVASGDSALFQLLDNYEVVPFGSYLDLNIYDYELPDSTLIGKVNFMVGEYPDPLNPYPSSLTIDQNGCSVTIYLRWED